MKHIESIQPELAADDITRLLVGDDDATATAALTRLLHDWTGCDIPQTSTLPESEVEELVPLCVSILRRHWQTPLTCLGDGITPMSLADLLRQSIGDRVQGNEALGIPPANANIPAALTALRDRHIADGLTLTLTDGTTTQAPDGISLAQLLCGNIANTITELKDDNVGWVMTQRFSAKTYFPNCEKMELGCEDIDVTFDYNGGTVFGSDVEYHLPKLKVIHPETINVGFGHGVFDCAVQTHDIYMPELERIESGSNFAIIRGMSAPNNTEPFSLYAPKLSSFGRGARLVRAYNACSTGLEKVVLGTIDSAFEFAHNAPSSGSGMATPNLVHLEFGQGTKASLNLKYWNPTTALAERLDEFLSNFKTYIADRVADRTGEYALTLTLSAAVYAALQAQEGQTILATLTSKNWTVAQA